MAWASLSNSIGSKPRVLAGPILRKVTPETATVWLAMREPGRVTLKVFDPSGLRMLEGTRHTIALGTKLHIVAVTATRQPPAAPLVENVVYRYDLAFAFDDSQSMNLATATGNASLSYAPFDKPTFCLPPKDINQLRMIHSSCRMPHGNGKDALPLVGQLISQTAQTPLQRPHQLLLMGDQIYADDVGAAMLIMLTDASDVLLGWKENLPVPERYEGLEQANKLPPYMRRELLKGAKFTSEDLDAHLLVLGEYLCMYLFVWSPVLWDASTVPLFADVVAAVRKGLGVEHVPPGVLPPGDDIEKHIKNLQSFAGGLTDVRRVLANIPSYMICDDHEVTDDWNMTLDICVGMYGNALGRRVIKNGIVAYSLCQHWGNVPEQFAEADASLPGTTLLSLLDKGNAATYETNAAKIDPIVSVHTDVQIKAKGAVFHDPNSLIFNYTIEGLGHQVIVTDTRTWRSFPRGGGEAPDLLSPDQFAAQIEQIQPKTAGRALLVVISTNAPPVEPIRSATRHDWIANHAAHFPDVHEAWDLPATAFDHLMKSVTERLTVVGNERKGPVMLLSGDVHIAFASRMLYKATRRFGEAAGAPPTTSVIAQLVASSLRKQTDSTLDLGTEGYTYAPHWYVKPMIGPHVEEFYAGWNVPAGGSLKAAKVAVGTRFGTRFVDRRPLRASGTLRIDEQVKVAIPPDYIYQLDYLVTTKSATVPNVPKPLPALPPGATADQRKQALGWFNTVTGNYRQYNLDPGVKRQIIGLNNVGELTFEWSNTDQKKVIHTIRWTDPSTSLVLFVDYVVNLDPNDTKFPFQPGQFKVVP
ncbi:hypothetical protein OM076_15540 [Solirubrobacter ginsenosidimutans]|uniref:PhoD-like phosphatase metallophosphatase domain-containing protein n=1 Tax=Solirubrobacter ginsenosidimutans TaxID=490573 RepID=A0A9X3MRL0_9ACTN|nr:hypothetical protein [Solirubrobacter ginsenosidimutans]MDA0161691.1 hypothetical protein [Solirubrobacter ginsenosidimutans]